MKIASSVLQKVIIPASIDKNIELFVKRDDLMHNEISGNKWRKLSRTLDSIGGVDSVKGIVTFGGAFSNHLLAVAYLANYLEISSVGIIRGEMVNPLNSTLSKCSELGMKFENWTREEYRNKSNESALALLSENYPQFHISPEGGADELGVEGCRDIVEEVNEEIDFDFISIDCGTGATLAGMSRSLKSHQKAIGVQVLKGQNFITKEVLIWNEGQTADGEFEVFTDYHFGGYAKKSEQLIDFMRTFYLETNIKLDPIYTAKQFYGMIDLIKKGYFPRGSKVVLVHSGGMQGLKGFEERYGVEIY